MASGFERWKATRELRDGLAARDRSPLELVWGEGLMWRHTVSLIARFKGVATGNLDAENSPSTTQGEMLSPPASSPLSDFLVLAVLYSIPMAGTCFPLWAFSFPIQGPAFPLCASHHLSPCPSIPDSLEEELACPPLFLSPVVGLSRVAQQSAHPQSY